MPPTYFSRFCILYTSPGRASARIAEWPEWAMPMWRTGSIVSIRKPHKKAILSLSSSHPLGETSGQRVRWVRPMMLLRLRGSRVQLLGGLQAVVVLTRKGNGNRRDVHDDEAETSADESRADPGTGESEQTPRHRPPREGTLGRGTRRAATSTDYGGPVARRRGAEDGGELEQTRRARRRKEQDFLRRSAGGCTKIRSSRCPRDHVEDG